MFTFYPCYVISYSHCQVFDQKYYLLFGLGIGSALTIVTSLCIAANFIGNDTAYGAFIYSLITFSEKISNGILIFIIEYV